MLGLPEPSKQNVRCARVQTRFVLVDAGGGASIHAKVRSELQRNGEAPGMLVVYDTYRVAVVGVVGRLLLTRASAHTSGAHGGHTRTHTAPAGMKRAGEGDAGRRTLPRELVGDGTCMLNEGSRETGVCSQLAGCAVLLVILAGCSR